MIPLHQTVFPTSHNFPHKLLYVNSLRLYDMGLNRHDASAAYVCNRRMAIRCMAIGRMHGALSYSGNIHPHRAPRPCPI